MTDSLFDAAFAKVKELVATFKANEARYLSPDYQEAEARKDFIDKFWIALGWDVYHDVQTNPYEQEVKVERGLSAGGQRRADYAFFLAPNFRDARFFVEAKKPAVQIGTKENHFQVIRYGWNSKTPLAVLTDFEQFHVLDCRYKPDISTALDRAVAKYHYSQYAERDMFAQIYWLFSREAVAAGSLEKRAAELREPRGKAAKRGLFPAVAQSIDESFLQELDEHRTALAHAFKDRNPRLDSETLTEITQRTLDRLVFLRFLEDKGIEPHRHVEKFCEKSGSWEHFIAASRRLDGIYNGIVFKQHAILDAPNFRVDADAFAEVCNSLSHTNSPYDFNAIPIHILGSIYERFLGKVIVATDKRVRIEDKPEVRKAGGVYYTPEYIVRYIVENTVGKLIAGKSPKQIAEMRFADIACGSGSFLLGTYDLLLRYHGNYYNAHPTRARKADCIKRDGKLYLSLRKKREILLNNIYGVDIDAQAVEVCQLSLYLKLLQDETTATAHEHQMEFHETLLPPLNKNIVCGNSLIGTDILEGQLFPKDEERKLNPMNFEDAFPEVMKHGGFDAIVGNPPYGHLLTKEGDEYVRAQLQTYGPSRDVYVAFIEEALSLLREGGKLSYIVPSAWLGGVAYRRLREMLCKVTIEEVICLPFDVFCDAYIDTLTFVVTKSSPSANHLVRGFAYPKRSKLDVLDVPSSEWQRIPLSVWQQSQDTKFVLSLGTLQILTRLHAICSTNIGDFAEMRRGVLFDKALLRDHKTNENSHRYFEGDVYRYEINLTLRHWVEYGSKMKEYPKEFKWFEGPRILLRRLVSRKQRLMACFTDKTFITNKNLYTLLPRTGKELRPGFQLFLLGVLNSKLTSHLYIGQVSQATKDDFPQVTIKDILELPLPAADKSRHDQMVRLVEAILEGKKQLAKAKTDKDKTYYENRCTGLDRQIDHLVYDLYGLTDKEIAIVERRS
jgi:adenine-specific DNA-methyltransferase